MKRTLLAAVFCCSLLGLAAYILVLPADAAKASIIDQLLTLPAPPAPESVNFQSPTEWMDTDGKTPPPDDAPIEEIIAFWGSQAGNFGGGYFQDRQGEFRPSETVVRRIVNELHSRPDLFGRFARVLSGSAAAADGMKRVYDSLPQDSPQREVLRDWLTMNSSYFVDDLRAAVPAIKDNDGTVANDDQFHALSIHDWATAKPLAEKMYNDKTQPASRILALWALYRQAVKENALGDIDRYRDELKAIVENRSENYKYRDLALDALLVEKDFAGRTDWYIGLMSDPTMLEMGTHTGLTTMVLQNPSGFVHKLEIVHKVY